MATLDVSDRDELTLTQKMHHLPVPRRRVYISCPMTLGDVKDNIDQAEAAFTALVAAGFAPFCPVWSYFAGGSYTVGASVRAYAHPNALGLTHESWLSVDLAWVAASDYVVRLPGDSRGADMEVKHAEELGIPVYSSVASLLAHCS